MQEIKKKSETEKMKWDKEILKLWQLLKNGFLSVSHFKIKRERKEKNERKLKKNEINYLIVCNLFSVAAEKYFNLLISGNFTGR